MSFIPIEKARCTTHKNYSEYVCGNGTCNRPIIMCSQCLQNHEKHEIAVYKLTQMVNKVKNNVQLLRKSTSDAKEKYAMIRSQTNGIQKDVKNREGMGVRRLMELIQQERKNIGQIKKQMIKKAQQIMKQKKDIQYLKDLRDRDLLQIKIKVSSQKGLDKLRRRLQEGNHPATKAESLKQMILDFQALKNTYQELRKNSLAQRIQQLIKFQLTKRSTMKKTQKTNCSSKASKHKRSQSETNIKVK